MIDYKLTLDTDVFRKLDPGEFELGEAAQNVLERGRRPEVLLLETEQLARVHVVIGVQDLRLHISRISSMAVPSYLPQLFPALRSQLQTHDIAHFRAGMDTGFVVSGIERVQVKALDRLGGPETDVGAVLRPVARDGSIIRDGQALHAARPDGAVGIGDILDVSVEPDRVGDV